MTRWRGFAALAGLLAAGALASGLAQPLPPPVRALSALLLVLVFPAALHATRLRLVRDDALPGLKLSIVFLAWLCVLALWTTAFTLCGASFRTYAIASTWFLLAVYAAAAIPAFRGAGTHSIRVPWAWWVLLIACALFAAAIPFRPTVGEDGLDHAGYLRRILTNNTLTPAGVLATPFGESPASPDPRKGALHPVLAFAAWLADADAITVWRQVPVIMFPAAVCAALAFNGAFLLSATARVAAGALVLLSFDGNPFRFAGASGHGETLASLWCWVLTAAVVAGGARRLPWFAWVLLSAGGVLIHLGVAVHVVLLAATTALLGGAWGIGRRERWILCVWLLAGLAAGAMMRHAGPGAEMNIIHSHTQGVMFVNDRWFVASPLDILRRHGMLFLGGLVCVLPLLFVIRSRSDARAIVAASAIPVAISFVPWIATTLFRSASYMVFRSLLHVPVYAATVVCASMLIRGLARRDARAWCIGVPAAAVWLFVFFRPVPSAIADDLRARARADGADAAETELIHAVAALPAGAVVLSDPATSYVLSAWTSHRFVAVYQQHGNPRDRFPLERVRSVRDVLSPFAGPDAAVAAARRFNVDYVVVNRTPPSDDLEFLRAWQGSSYEAALHRMTALAPSFAPIDTAGNAVIFRFHGAAPVSHSYTTQAQPVVVSERPLSPCEVSAPHDAFAITGISVSPERALPGDALQVTLGYVRDAPIPFQLPVVIHVRFDNEAVSSAREFPGDKQWRRWRDRRERTRSRFREDFLPGHGVYDPDLWPTGVALAETFTAVVPESARHGRYRVEVSIEPLTQIPNFHARDLLFNRDHYSGKACATLDVSGHAVGTGASP